MVLRLNARTDLWLWENDILKIVSWTALCLSLTCFSHCFRQDSVPMPAILNTHQMLAKLECWKLKGKLGVTLPFTSSDYCKVTTVAKIRGRLLFRRIESEKGTFPNVADSINYCLHWLLPWRWKSLTEHFWSKQLMDFAAVRIFKVNSICRLRIEMVSPDQKRQIVIFSVALVIETESFGRVRFNQTIDSKLAT